MAVKFRKLIYQSPSGARIELQFRDLRDTQRTRIGKFDFVGVDGSYLQHNGMDAQEFPCEMTLSGPDYQERLGYMREMFREKGIGTLYHPDPSIGAIYVVVETVDVSQGVVIDAGYAKISVTFRESIFSTTDTQSRPSDIAEVTSLANVAIADAGSWLSDLINTISSAYSAAVGAIDSVTKVVKDVLGEVLKISNELFSAFNNAVASILGLADTLVFAPLEAINQIKAMVALVEESIDSIEDRIKAYGDAIKKTFGIEDDTLPPPDIQPDMAVVEPTPETRNRAIISQFYAVNLMCGMAKTIVSADYTNRQQALSAVRELLLTYEYFSQALDKIQTNFSGNPRSLQFVSLAPQLRGLVMRAAYSIQRLAYSLDTQRTETLAQDTPLVVLAARFYGDVSESTLRRLITDNRLTGRDVVMAPSGRKVVYYA